MWGKKIISLKKITKLGMKLFLVSILSSFFLACQKDIAEPVFQPTFTRSVSMHLSASKIVLLQGNEDRTAIQLDWNSAQDGHNESISYTIETATAGSQFAAPIELGTCAGVAASFTVKEFNKLMRRLITPGSTSRVEFRVKIVKACTRSTVTYSDPIALDVTPYQPIIEYDNAKIIRIPGNFQNWKLVNAPKVIAAKNAGEYEGYINFSNPYSQFLMVKGTTEWDPKVTYNYIGANKFGFGGSMFSIFGGAGVYRLQVNTNTNTWSYTKINSWGLSGSAVSGDAGRDAAMVFDEITYSWRITLNLVKGNFLFKANNSNAISFGQDTSGEIGIPDYKGDPITIEKSGNYTIRLDLTQAGNYAYSIQKNN